MCTVVLLRRPEHEWPLLVAANRDERVSRAWDPLLVIGQIVRK